MALAGLDRLRHVLDPAREPALLGAGLVGAGRTTREALLAARVAGVEVDRERLDLSEVAAVATRTSLEVLEASAQRDDLALDSCTGGAQCLELAAELLCLFQEVVGGSTQGCRVDVALGQAQLRENGEALLELLCGRLAVALLRDRARGVGAGPACGVGARRRARVRAWNPLLAGAVSADGLAGEAAGGADTRVEHLLALELAAAATGRALVDTRATTLRTLAATRAKHARSVAVAAEDRAGFGVIDVVRMVADRAGAKAATVTARALRLQLLLAVAARAGRAATLVASSAADQILVLGRLLLGGGRGRFRLVDVRHPRARERQETAEGEARARSCRGSGDLCENQGPSLRGDARNPGSRPLAALRPRHCDARPHRAHGGGSSSGNQRRDGSRAVATSLLARDLRRVGRRSSETREPDDPGIANVWRSDSILGSGGRRDKGAWSSISARSVSGDSGRLRPAQLGPVLDCFSSHSPKARPPALSAPWKTPRGRSGRFGSTTA